MGALRNRRVVISVILCFLPVVIGQDYQVPDVRIQALKPSGIQISIPDNPKITLFAFQGQVNKNIEDEEVGDISAEVTRAQNGQWTFQDENVQLNVGDVINYYVHIVRNGKGYHKVGLSHTVTELVDPQSAERVPPTTPPRIPNPIPTQASNSYTPPSQCRPTPTVVRDGTVCSGQIIFEDNFDTLREDLWVVEQYIPTGPDYPFVSYQRPSKAPTVAVEDGMLKIQPILQETLPGFDSEYIILDGNRLDLSSGCTRPNTCTFQNQGSQIMPPIASGRLISNFGFKYGVIIVRAKLPQGDWLYPDIILESMIQKYGVANYASGVLRIAGARGNPVLSKGDTDYSNKVLYGGPIMDYKCRDNLTVKKESLKDWGDDFHIYTLRWAPERITLLVDGDEWGRIEPRGGGLQARLPAPCGPPRALLLASTPLAPFDDFFRIALGVAAGGITQFPEGATSQNSAPKPWKNSATKARVSFLGDKDVWTPTWTAPQLIVDYVRVHAI